MTEYIAFALIGLGAGAVYAGLALGLVVAYKGTGIINFAQGALAMWGAYVYSELRTTGTLVLPVVGISGRIPLGHPLGFWPAALLGVLTSTVLALLGHLLVFRMLRAAPSLARVTASVGVMLTLEAVATIQFGSQQRVVASFLPDQVVHLGGVAVPSDRFYLAFLALAASVCLAAYFRFSRTGIATRAVAENPLAVSLAGRSPERLAAASWGLSGLLAGAFGILIAPITGLNPVSYTLFVIPALAVAVVGRLSSTSLVCMSGLLLGAVQSEIVFLQTKSWYPVWAVTGATDALPFLVLTIALYFFGGRRLPNRGELEGGSLPDLARRPRLRVAVPLALTVGVVGLVLLKGSYRFGLIESLILALLMLSFVVLTGLLGQISFAQAAFAGTGGFLLSKLAVGLSVPFPFSMILAASLTTILGLLVALPALRIRGVQLAIITLAAAVALQRFVFDNPQLTPEAGNPIPNPHLGPIDLGIRAGDQFVRLQFGLLALAVLAVVAIGVVNLTWSASGRRLLAVRSNERAAAAVGISVHASKLLAFGLSSFIAGLGGAMLGFSRGELTAASFDVFSGIELLVFAYLGGVTTVGGALIGGLLAPLGLAFVVLNRIIDLGDYYLLVSGLSVIAITIFNPSGLAGVAPMIAGLWRAKPRPHPAGLHPDVIGTGLNTPLAVPSWSGSDRGRTILDVRGLSVSFGGNRVLHDVSLRAGRGSIVGVIGPNGAGKTTLLDALTGFVSYSGQILFRGQSIDDRAPHRRARAGVARTWQSVELFRHLTVGENVTVGKVPPNLKSLVWDLVVPRRTTDDPAVAAALQSVELTGCADLRTEQLSLGQQKLVGVARALAAAPDLLLLDEPAAGLGTAETRLLGQSMQQLATLGLSILIVEHDIDLVLDVCDYLYVLDFGRVIAEGLPKSVMQSAIVRAAYLGVPADAASNSTASPRTSAEP